MWISKTPLRLSFLGGGTDLPEFFQREDGATLSGAINKYIFVSLHPRFDGSYRISYENTELCKNLDQVVHPVAKSVLTKYERGKSGLDVVSYSDIPAGTGLGSSSCFTVGLLNAIHNQQGRVPSIPDLANEACEIELEQNPKAIGRQDQYAVTFGGLNVFRFQKNGQVEVEPIKTSETTITNLQEHLVLFYTGLQRPAARLLKKQSNNVERNLSTLRKMRDLVFDMRDLLEKNAPVEDIGLLLNESWKMKRTLADGITNEKVDRFYARAVESGAVGGKLMGAGAGGFMMFICPPQKQPELIESMSDLSPMRVEFDFKGTRMLNIGEKETRGEWYV